MNGICSIKFTEYPIFSLSMILSLLFAASCGPLSELRSDEKEEVIVEETAEEQEEGDKATPDVTEVLEIPEWHNPNQPFKITADSILVSASAVSSDSTDARKIAEIAVRDQKKVAYADLSFDKLQNKGAIPSKSDTQRKATREQIQVFLSSIDLGSAVMESQIPCNEKIFFFTTENQVRCYILHACEKTALESAIRAAADQ